MRATAMLAALLVVTAAPTAARAEEHRVHSELEPVDLAKRLEGLTFVFYGGAAPEHFTFARGGVLHWAVPEGQLTGKGTWRVSGKGSVEGSYRPTNADRDFSKSWFDITASDSGLFHLVEYSKSVFGKMVTAEFLLECNASGQCEQIRFSSCPDGRGKPCTHMRLFKILPGSADRTLYDAVLKKLSGKQDHTLVAGAPAKKARSVSEIWWVGTSAESTARGYTTVTNEAEARKLAAHLEPVIGKVEVKEWTFSRPPYRAIVVVGEHKPGEAAPAKPLRIKLMDGACARGASGCTNPALAGVRAALEQAGHAIVAVEPAKKQRTASEVWFMAGHEQAAREIATRLLAGKITAGAVKQWTWGGDFDVLVVVAD